MITTRRPSARYLGDEYPAHDTSGQLPLDLVAIGQRCTEAIKRVGQRCASLRSFLLLPGEPAQRLAGLLPLWAERLVGVPPPAHEPTVVRHRFLRMPTGFGDPAEVQLGRLV